MKAPKPKFRGLARKRQTLQHLDVSVERRSLSPSTMAPSLPKRKHWRLTSSQIEELKTREPLTLTQLQAAATKPSTTVLPRDLEQLGPQWPNTVGNKFVSLWQCPFDTSNWRGKACRLNPSARNRCSSKATAATHIRKAHFPGFTWGFGGYG